MSDFTLYAIVATYNRLVSTQASLDSLRESALRAGVNLHVFAIDDGSTDGTPQWLATGDDVTLLHGDGQFFWAKCMAHAEHRVLTEVGAGNDAVILWLNDDVLVSDSAVSDILTQLQSHSTSILIGATLDRDGLRTTYSGMVRNGIHPLSFARISPNGRLQSVDVFNGNFVAMRLATAQKMGGIDGGFAHGMADIEYGLRASRLGIERLLLPQAIGVCDANPVHKNGKIRDEWRRFIGVKGAGHPRSMAKLFRSAAPRSWPLWVVLTYVKWWTRISVIAGRNWFGGVVPRKGMSL